MEVYQNLTCFVHLEESVASGDVGRKFRVLDPFRSRATQLLIPSSTVVPFSLFPPRATRSPRDTAVFFSAASLLVFGHNIAAFHEGGIPVCSTSRRLKKTRSEASLKWKVSSQPNTHTCSTVSKIKVRVHGIL